MWSIAYLFTGLPEPSVYRLCLHTFFVYFGLVMHIGQRIHDVLEEQGRIVVWFAGELSCHRTNIYKIFSKNYIDTQDLMRISKILNHDFFQEYSRELSQE